MMAPEIETVGSTQITNDALSRVAVRTNVGSLPSGLDSAAQSGFSDDLKTFLSKPMLLSQGVWAAQGAGTILATVLTPKDLLDTEIYQQKVRGFYGFKATTLVTLQVNATKFQAGRAIMVFIPQAGIPDTYPGMRLRSLRALTQLPRVELDLSKDTQVTMEIPYVSPNPYYNMAKKDNHIGKLYIIVYSALALGTGGSDHVDYTVWGSFKDPQLVTPMYETQMGRPGKATATQEAESLEGISLSSALASSLSVAGAVTGVPMLSNLAGKANWLRSAMSKSAAAFGYSKPSSDSPMVKFYNAGQYNMANADGGDVAPHLAMASDSTVGVLPGYGGSDQDEMAISHVIQIGSYHTAFNWADTDAAGFLLWSTALEPHLFEDQATSAAPLSQPVCDPSPVAFISKWFRFWRGSFVFTLKIVKTQFHSGRLLFYYNPNPSDLSPLDIDQTQFCYRQIIDVREKSEWTFTVPYVSTKQYHATTAPFFDGPFDPTGTVGLIVLNDLVHPETTSSTVNILLEVAAGPDFEFAVPAGNALAPVISNGWATEMGDVVSATNSGDVDCTQCNVAVGGGEISSPDMEPSEFCIGEKVLSLLQLMKRYSFMRFVNDEAAAGETASRIMRPYCLTYIRTTETYPADISPGPYCDPHSMFGTMYAYSRGSMRIGFTPFTVTNVINNDSPWMLSAGLTDSTTIYGTTDDNYVANRLVHIFPGTSRATKFVHLPAYSQNYCRLNRPNTAANTTSSDEYSCNVFLRLQQIPAIANRSLYMRSVGEDFNFGYFLGTPLYMGIDLFA